MTRRGHEEVIYASFFFQESRNGGKPDQRSEQQGDLDLHGKLVGFGRFVLLLLRFNDVSGFTTGDKKIRYEPASLRVSTPDKGALH